MKETNKNVLFSVNESSNQIYSIRIHLVWSQKLSQYCLSPKAIPDLAYIVFHTTNSLLTLIEHWPIYCVVLLQDWAFEKGTISVGGESLHSWFPV